MGGKPGQALYFVGMQGQDLIFLDPHLVQDSVSHDDEYLYKDWYECDNEDISINVNKSKKLKSKIQKKEWSKDQLNLAENIFKNSGADYESKYTQIKISD